MPAAPPPSPTDSTDSPAIEPTGARFAKPTDEAAGVAGFVWGEMLDERSGEVFYARSALDAGRNLMRRDWQWTRPVALGGSGRGSRGTNVISKPGKLVVGGGSISSPAGV